MNIIEKIRQLNVSADISSQDTMFQTHHERHYFYVGRSNLLAIYSMLHGRLSYRSGDTPIENILDVGCGHGRVVRWVRAAFPDANYYVTDYDKVGVEWCVKNFDCIDTYGEIPPKTFDLVWLSSVFTHLPQQTAKPLLQTLLASLKPNGVLGFTIQGRYSIERMKDFDWNSDERNWMHYNLDKAHFDNLAALYDKSGYGYVDYPNQVNYGVCISRPDWYTKIAMECNDFIQILFQEKGVDNHQDVIAFMRADLLDDAKGVLWS